MTFNNVCKELNLINTPDWGIINADSSRVEEFIDYVLNHDILDFSIKYEFLELIISSMNAALVENKSNCCLKLKFYRYIKPLLYNTNYYPHIPYWISIKSRDEYPVGELLKSYLII